VESNFCRHKKVQFFCENHTVAEKLQKSEKKFLAESDFWDRVWGISQKSDWIIAKIVFFDPKSDFFRKKFCKKIFANIFAMSATVSPWGGGFESRFLAKSGICGIFCCILRKSCFSASPF
jgi:hypothetical protein